MARMTVAQLRERELDRLVEYKTKNPTDEDYDEARRNMNSYYRLCGLSERNLEMQNNPILCNTGRAARSEYKEMEWHKRLNRTFEDTYGLSLVYCGYHPSIGITDKNGGFFEKISTYFYN